MLTFSWGWVDRVGWDRSEARNWGLSVVVIVDCGADTNFFGLGPTRAWIWEVYGIALV